MYFSWFHFTKLALESSRVIGLRCGKVARGGSQALREIQLMHSEKQLAYWDVCAAMAGGATANAIVELYRSRVAANQARLGASLS